MSLTEELRFAPRRKDGTQLEREKTERMLGEWDLVLEMRMRDLVTREEEQRRLELELLHLIGIGDLRFLSRSSSPIRSP